MCGYLVLAASAGLLFQGAIALAPTARLHSELVAAPLSLAGCRGFECLQRYIDTPDLSYSWTLTNQSLGGVQNGVRWTGYVIEMISQKWLMPNESTRQAWVHPLVVIVPSNLDAQAAGWATLFVGSGHSGDFSGGVSELWGDVQNAIHMATHTRAIAATVLLVPNQYLSFAADPEHRKRDEDGIKAYTWAHFQAHPDHPEWLLELPNAKACVRAMDTVAAFTETLPSGQVDRFGITGASKRGMASLQVAAYDARVKAVIPAVITLNLPEHNRQAMACLGNPVVSMTDYYENEVFKHMDTPVTDDMFRIIDPYFYIERLDMPKMWLSAGNDNFFMPDHLSSFWKELPEPKHMYNLGNSQHLATISMSDFLPAAISFMEGVILGESMPNISWTVDNVTGFISVRQWSNHTPSSVQLWTAETCSSKRRDFRRWNLDGPEDCRKCGGRSVLFTCVGVPTIWSSTPLLEVSPGSRTWEAQVRPPGGGRWAAFYIGFEYPRRRSGSDPWRLSTEVSVVPRSYPFEPCYGERCMGDRLVLAATGADRHAASSEPAQ